MGIRRDKLLKIVANQGRAQAPNARAQLKLGALEGSSFTQGAGDKKKMTHVRAEQSAVMDKTRSETVAIVQSRKARRGSASGASNNTRTSDMFSGTFTDEKQRGTQQPGLRQPDIAAPRPS